MSNNKISPLLVLAGASIALTFAFAGCNNSGTQTQPAATGQSQNSAAPGQPAAAETPQEAESSGNLMQASGDNTSQDQNDSGNDYDADAQDSNYGQPALQASQPPPELPEYSQPEMPGDGYIWT